MIVNSACRHDTSGSWSGIALAGSRPTIADGGCTWIRPGGPSSVTWGGGALASTNAAATPPTSPAPATAAAPALALAADSGPATVSEPAGAAAGASVPSFFFLGAITGRGG